MDNTTAVWINALRNAQKAIRTAILGKGVQITGDLSSYPDAINQLKNPRGSKSISTNGTHDVADVAEAIVAVPQISTSSRTFTANGTYQADSGTAWDNITINVPSSGIIPSGTENINQNGLYDITNKAYVNVAVPAGASVVTGQVSGSGSRSLTISDAVGKDNVVLFLINTSSSSVNATAILNAASINGSAYMTYKSSSNILRVTSSDIWNKDTGTVTSSNMLYMFSNNTNLKYVFVAW